MKNKEQDKIRITGLRTIIVGGNKVATQLAEKLIQFEHDIVIIEQNYQRAKEIENKIDLLVIEGEAIDYQVLKQAEIDKAQLLIAVTDDDQYNLLAGLYAKQAGVKRVIVKLNNQNYLYKAKPKIDLVINPKQAIIKRIKGLIKPDLEFSSLIKKECKISKLKIEHNHKFCYQQIASLNLPKEVLIVTILRGEKAVIPHGKSKIYPGDSLLLLFKSGLRYKLNRLVTRSSLGKKKLILVGANNISYNLARLKGIKSKIIIIDSDYKKCKRFANKLDDALILHGSGSDVELLKEEGIKDSDIFAAVTKNDEINLLLAQLATKLGAKFSIAVVNNLIYQNIIDFFAIDEIINPAVKVIDQIMEYLLRGESSNNLLYAGQLRLDSIKYNSSQTKLLKELSLPGDALIIYLLKPKGELIIPNGDTEITKGCQLNILHSNSNLESLQRCL